MAAEFLLPRSEGRPLTVRLERDAVVGRGTDAGLRISSRRVSRSHCHLRVDGSVVRVRDLGSRNGTFVNGEGVGEEEIDVPLGGTLSIGGVTMKLVRAGDRSYRPDGAAMLAEAESHVSESDLSGGDLQDSPSGVVVGQEPAEELSDDSVLVSDSGTGFEQVNHGEARDRSDRPSPIRHPGVAAPPVAEPDPIVVEAPADDAAAEFEDAVETEEGLNFDEEEFASAEEEDDSGEMLLDEDDEPESRVTIGASGAESESAFGGDDGSETITEEDAAFDFLNDDDSGKADADSSALKALPGADAEDESSFAGFGDADDEDDVDSSLLGFLNDPK
ncbi:FHA domain-containing protein [Alienimonas californiensis]|uniref:FHA domain-containing protein FhaA n=1 Tax=Alienimonas californiensis TaxID=2527989 RepID=A0A517PCB8_9PLAN|nr:FHA domain-containing protein [Alienimonas californiensis]QDT17009.1 FHA domain-containing protein FhaA [Alienimonas californiensis]